MMLHLVPEPVQEQVALARYTTMRVGGPARYLAHVGEADAVLELADWAQREGISWLVLGEGSNVICSDSGYDGLVIIYQKAGAEPVCSDSGGGPGTVWDVPASMPLSNLARWTARRGLAGLEWAAHLPGTVGGAVVGNAGAFGSAISDVLSTATVARAGAVTLQSVAAVGPGYRTSALAQERGPFAVLEVRLRLVRDDPTACLARLAEAGQSRLSRHPGGASSGCVFRNPPGGSAGQLLDQCGLKGRSVGDAVYSDRHANFVINRGRARAADVVALMRIGRQVVWQERGVVLEPEVRFIGEITLGDLE